MENSKWKTSTPVEVPLTESGGFSTLNPPETLNVFDSNMPVEETVLEELEKEHFNSDWPWVLKRTHHKTSLTWEELLPYQVIGMLEDSYKILEIQPPRDIYPQRI